VRAVKRMVEVRALIFFGFPFPKPNVSIATGQLCWLCSHAAAPGVGDQGL
jgi:hypothetical protein